MGDVSKEPSTQNIILLKLKTPNQKNLDFTSYNNTTAIANSTQFFNYANIPASTISSYILGSYIYPSIPLMPVICAGNPSTKPPLLQINGPPNSHKEASQQLNLVQGKISIKTSKKQTWDLSFGIYFSANSSNSTMVADLQDSKTKNVIPTVNVKHTPLDCSSHCCDPKPTSDLNNLYYIKSSSQWKMGDASSESNTIDIYLLTLKNEPKDKWIKIYPTTGGVPTPAGENRYSSSSYEVINLQGATSKLIADSKLFMLKNNTIWGTMPCVDQAGNNKGISFRSIYNANGNPLEKPYLGVQILNDTPPLKWENGKIYILNYLNQKFYLSVGLCFYIVLPP